MNVRLRLRLEWLLIGLISSLLIALATQWRGTDSFDNLVYDQLSSLSRPAADKKILLVNIDDRSLTALGKWPWARRPHAELITRLKQSAPRSIAIDIILSEPGDPADDTALAEAVSGGAPTFLPVHFVTPGYDGRAYDTVPPIPELAKAAAGLGHVNLEFDGDGVVRRMSPCFGTEVQSWQHLMVKVYTAKGEKLPASFPVGDCNVLNMIPFSKRGSFAEVSYIDVLDGSIPAELIAGRDIIVGASAAGMGDSFPVPLADGGTMPGAEIMANFLSSMRANTSVVAAPFHIKLLYTLLPMWALLIGFLRWRPRSALIASLVAVIAVLGFSVAGLNMRYWIPPGAALLGVFLVYPLWGWRRLQAMSDFMRHELQSLSEEGEAIPIKVPQARAADLVGRQSAALSSAIDHMRDLRRFVADALSDLPDPMVITDMDGKITLQSDLVTARMGQSVVGMYLKDVFKIIVLPDYLETVLTYLESDISQRNRSGPKLPADNPLVRFATSDGRTFIMRKASLDDASDARRGYIYYLADISALAHAEGEREQVLQLLSHDMRAPQSAIIALLDGKIEEPEKKRIESNARRTIQLAQDFVDIARMGESKFAGDDVLLSDLIQDVADNFWPLAKERGVHIAIEDNSAGAFVIAEPDSLSRAFSNLIDNAIKFSPAGGQVSINITKEFEESSSKISVAIQDQGDGIDPDVIPRLFSRFASSGVQQGRIKGTGLGLTYVKAVVERHNGQIEAYNLPHKGACFAITLPEAPETEVAETQARVGEEEKA
jgi:CHASE2 domain-containing sensor protein/signal transduction histidine kinase